ncbi:MAG: hypothetical protein FJ279_18220, partial [Planctomycetes bacterium]|nr:hypothetical protein [Planctomycetota bacterium]
MRQEQIEFTSGGVRLFGMLHRAELGADHKSGMVFCHPFGEERKSAFRAMVAAARAFADDGFTVLRFDYRGCGDSEGEFRDATLAAQMADVRAALVFLRSR